MGKFTRAQPKFKRFLILGDRLRQVGKGFFFKKSVPKPKNIQRYTKIQFDKPFVAKHHHVLIVQRIWPDDSKKRKKRCL